MVILAGMSSDPATAAGQTATSFTVAALVAVAEKDSKELQAARYAVEIGRAKLAFAGLMPNPRLEFGGVSDFAFRNNGAYSASVGISQDFPVTGRLLREQELARVDVAAAEAEIDDAARRLAGDVVGDAYQLMVLDRQIAARGRLIDIDQRLLKAAQARVKSAEVSELDVNTASIELERLRNEQALLNSQRASLVPTINVLIGHPPDARLVLAEQEPVLSDPGDPGQLQTRALATRPDLRKAEMEADRAGAEKVLARAQRWEDWNVRVGLQQDRQVVDGAPSQRPDQALGVSLSIPIPVWNDNRGPMAAAEATEAQARSRIVALKLTISGEVLSAAQELARLKQVLTHDREMLLPVAKRTVSLAQKGYAQGLVTLADVIQVQRQEADLEFADLEALGRYGQALARLRTATNDYPLLPADEATSGDAEDH